MWSDKETSEDFLGFSIHANLIKNVVLEDNNLPVTIGLYGDWGSGKSSVLKILEKTLEQNDDSTAVITFDGWAYESFDDAKMSLISGIVDKILSCRNWEEKVLTCGKNLKDKILSMRSLMWSLKNFAVPTIKAFSTDGISLIPILLSLIKEGKFDSSSEEITNYLKGFTSPIKQVDDYKVVHEFRDDFTKLIEATKLKRIVILVDDLDRCLSRHIIDTLEVIKLFLNVPKTAFVIAADEGIVANAISQEYGTIGSQDSKDKRDIGKNYMEKFIQIPYTLPQLSDFETITYITLLLCQSTLPEGQFSFVYEDYKKFQCSERFRPYDSSVLQERVKNIDDAESLYKVIAFVGQFAPLIANSLRRNPRMIKRFLNAYELRKRLLEANEIKDQKSVFALLKLMLLEQKSPALFKELHKFCMSSNSIPQELLDIEGASKQEREMPENLKKDWEDKDILRLFAEEPLFSQVNLRELYWVSRDNIVDTMGGAALIPQRIKKLFEDMIAESSTAVIIKSSCEKLASMSKDDINDFFVLLDNRILTSPENKKLYNVYFALCGNETFVGAYDKFIHILQRIEFAKLTLFSMGNEFKQLLDRHGGDKKLENIIRKNKQLERSVFPKIKN